MSDDAPALKHVLERIIRKRQPGTDKIETAAGAASGRRLSGVGNNVFAGNPKNLLISKMRDFCAYGIVARK